jgi:hypothetical protein
VTAGDDDDRDTLQKVHFFSIFKTAFLLVKWDTNPPSFYELKKSLGVHLMR